MQNLQKTQDLVDKQYAEFTPENYQQGGSTPLKIITGGHRKVSSEFNVKSKLAQQQQFMPTMAHQKTNSLMDEQLQQQITQNLLQTNNPKFQSPKIKLHIQDKTPNVLAFQNQEKFLKINLNSRQNPSVRRNQNNSQISNSNKCEVSQSQGRNHKPSNTMDKNTGKNMSMLNTYETNDSRDKTINVAQSNQSIPRMMNKISIDIKPKQQPQIYQNGKNENIKITQHRIQLKHIETSKSSEYNDDDDDHASLSKSQNNDSKEGEFTGQHTLEISRSKYEGDALKTKRNSTRIKLINKGECEKKGKLQNKCKVLTNTNSKESCLIDFNKLTIDETNQSYLSVIGLNGHINKVLQSPQGQHNTKINQLFKQIQNSTSQKQNIQNTVRARSNHPQYFMTFQQNEILKNDESMMPQIGNGKSKTGPLLDQKNMQSLSQMNSTVQEEQANAEFQKFSMFNNFAYQNIINQNPSQLFKKGQNLQQNKIDGTELFQPNLVTQSSQKKHQILKKIQNQKTLQPTIITSPDQQQNQQQKQFPALHIGDESLFERQQLANKKYHFNQLKMQQSKLLPQIQSQMDKVENVQYQKLFQQYLLNQEKWIQVLQSQLGLQKPTNVAAMMKNGKNAAQQGQHQQQTNSGYIHQGNELDIPNADQSFWQKLLTQQNEYQGHSVQTQKKIPHQKNISIERINNQIAHNQQAQQQNMFMNGLCGYSLNSIIQTFQESKMHQENQIINSQIQSPQEINQIKLDNTIEAQMQQYQYSFQKEQARLRREQRKVAVQSQVSIDRERQKCNKSPLQKVKQTPPEMPATNVVIHHQFDASLHFNHRTNVVIRNINSVIRLIFKNTKEQAAITAIHPGNSIHQMQTYIDDHRIKEIQKIANTMKVNIPRRFDSKTAIREYIQSREFITAMKQSITQQLFAVINSSNGTIGLISAKQQKIAGFYDKRELLRRQEREFYAPREPQGSNFAAATPRYQSPVKKVPSQVVSPEKKIKKNFSPRKTDKKFHKTETVVEEENTESKTPTKQKKESAKETRKLRRKEEKEAIQKQKQEDENLKKLIDEKIEEEQYRRQEEELDPMKKEDRIKIEKQLIEQRERLKEKEKLLQFNQKFAIGYGNNYQIVKQVIKHRYWWAPAPNEEFVDANFIWTSWKREKHIDYLKENGQMDINQPIKIYGRIDNNKQLTNKKGLFINMREYYNACGIDPFSILPVTYLAKHAGDVEFFKFEKHFNKIAQQIQESSTNCKNEIKQYKQQKRKEILKSIYEKQKHTTFDESQSEDEADLLELYEDENIKIIRRKYKGPLNTWIIKPGENTNRGQGINVSRDLGEIKGLISGGRTRDGQACTYIIQKYIDYPLLIHKRKFDFRVYALVTSINKQLKGYFYEDGYIRTSSREFDLNALDDKFIHLTNDAIQKQAEDFGKFENFNKMSYGDFQRYLNTFHDDMKIDVQQHIIPQIKRLILDTIRATCFKLDSRRLLNSFEILGYDFMLDENFKLSLIEVNTNPCLETESPLLSRIIPELIENTFKSIISFSRHEFKQKTSSK